MTGYEHLLQPITIGTLELKNRLLLTPMGTELGTHDALLAADGAYAALWRSWHGGGTRHLG